MFVVRQLRPQAKPDTVASAIRWQSAGPGGRPAYAVVRDEHDVSHLLERTGPAIPVKRGEYVEITLEKKAYNDESNPVLRGKVTHAGRAYSLAAHLAFNLGVGAVGLGALIHGCSALWQGGDALPGLVTIAAGAAAASLYLRQLLRSVDSDREVVNLSLEPGHARAEKLVGYTEGKARVIEASRERSEEATPVPMPARQGFCLQVATRQRVTA